MSAARLRLLPLICAAVFALIHPAARGEGAELDLRPDGKPKTALDRKLDSVMAALKLGPKSPETRLKILNTILAHRDIFTTKLAWNDDSEKWRKVVVHLCERAVTRMLERDPDTMQFTDQGEKAAAVLAYMGDMNKVHPMLEWRVLIKGLSSKDRKVRIKAFDEAIRGGVLSRALLWCAMQGKQYPPARELKLAQTKLHPGETLTFRYEVTIHGSPGVWLTDWNRYGPLGQFESATNEINIAGKAARSGRSGAYGFRNGSRTNHPMFWWRFVLKDDSELFGSTKIGADNHGVVVIEWRPFTKDSDLTVPKKHLPKNEVESWSFNAPQQTETLYWHIPVLPRKKLLGKPVNGLRLRVLGLQPPSKPRPVRYDPHKTRFRGYEPDRGTVDLVRSIAKDEAGDRTDLDDEYALVVRLAVTDDAPHIIPVSDRDDLYHGSLWLVVVDEDDMYILDSASGITKKLYEDRDEFMTLQRGKLDSYRGTMPIMVPRAPGRYTAYVGYGRHTRTMTNAPDKRVWEGELVAEPFHFQVTADGKMKAVETQK